LSGKAYEAHAPSTPLASDILHFSEELKGDLDDSQTTERVQNLIREAVSAGATTWDPDERAQLRRVVARWTSALQRAGQRAALPDLLPFSGHLPSFTTLEAKDLVDRLHAGKPVVACRIEGADLRDLDGIKRVRIVDCVLIDANLSGITLPGARLLHTTFENCNLSGTRLPDVVVTSSIFARGNLVETQASRGTFCGSRFEGVDMSNGDFSSASFAASTLRKTEAREADFDDALFDLATIESANFERARASDGVFTGATIRSSTFHQTDLTRALFSSADLRGSEFEGAQLEEASFETAVEVSRATFSPAAIEEASFSAMDAAALRSSDPGQQAQR
jgi:uncharacterized protein YjbI with pentapeptide repeats